MRGAHRLALVLPAEWDGGTARVAVRVLDLPQRTENGMRYLLELEPSAGSGPPLRHGLRIQLHVPDQPWPDPPEAVQAQVRALQGMRADERWQLALRVRVPRGLMNPNGFDQELLHWTRQIQATASPDWRALPPTRLAPARSWRLNVWRERVRSRMADRMQTSEPRAAQLVTALTMGDQSAIASDDWRVFRDTGVAHLVSISGLHITGLAGMAALLMGGLWRGVHRMGLAVPGTRQAWMRWGGLSVALMYAAFAGWGIPAQRTVLMLFAWCVLRQLGLKWPWPVQCMWVMALVLAFDPWAMVQAGFWLSFVAVAVLLYDASPPGAPEMDSIAAQAQAAKTPDGLLPRLMRRLGQAFWQLLRLQITLLLALAPITALWFGQLSLVGVLANLLAVPWVTLVITPLAVLGLAWPALWPWSANLAEPLLAALRYMATWPGASWRVADAPMGWSALAMLGAALFVLTQRRPHRWRWCALAVILITPALMWRAPRPDVGQFEVIALDVGQGSAVLVRTAHHTLLYDAGPAYGPSSSAGERVVLPALQGMGDALDRLVLSHADADHSGGASQILAQTRADLWGSLAASDPWVTQRPDWQACAVGQNWVWDGVRFEVLFPSAHWVAGPRDRNAGSCVMRVSSTPQHGAPQVLLLTGDIGKPQEGALQLDQPRSKLRATLMMASHHGSNHGNSAEFLQAVSPSWVFVQAGHANRFGHPAPAMLARAKASGAQVRVTADCGAMHWQSIQPNEAQCQRDLNRRYWHAQVTPVR